MRRYFSSVCRPASLEWKSVRSILQTCKEGESIVVKGWTRSVRKQKSVAFLEVDDGSSVVPLQIVSTPKQVEQIGTGCSLEISGTVVELQGQKQSKEIQATDIKIIGTADASFPLQKKFHSVEFLRQLPHLRPMTRTIGAISRVRNAASHQLHTTLQNLDFLHVHTPIITSNDCEGGGEQFSVQPASEINNNNNNSDTVPPFTSNDSKFFGSDAFLTVSGQLHAEAFAHGLSRVYTFGPTFRAENSNSTRHLAEFWMLEPEAAFFDKNQAMDLAEFCIKSTISTLMEHHMEDLDFLYRHMQGENEDVSLVLANLVDKKYERIKYHDAMKILLNSTVNFETKPVLGEPLNVEHERYLAQEFQNAVFVTDFPADCKPFYCLQNDDDENGYNTVQCFDLLAPKMGEIVGGSAREHRLERLQKAMINKGGPSLHDGLWWYQDLRRYGSAPSAGFGLGFDRLLMLVTGVANVRDTSPIPRHVGNCKL